MDEQRIELIACDHGSLKRQCRVCELEAEVEALRQLKADLYAQHARDVTRAESAEAESAARLRVLNAKAEELRAEWIRAENAEAELQHLRIDLADERRRIHDFLYVEPLQLAEQEEAERDVVRLRAELQRLREGMTTWLRWLRFHADEPHVVAVEPARVSYLHCADMLQALLVEGERVERSNS